MVREHLLTDFLFFIIIISSFESHIFHILFETALVEHDVLVDLDHLDHGSHNDPSAVVQHDHLPKQLALKMDGAKASHLYPAVRSEPLRP